MRRDPSSDTKVHNSVIAQGLGRGNAVEISFTLQELVEISDDIKVEGDINNCVTGIASLKDAVGGDLSFLGNPKYAADVKTSEASVIFLPLDYVGKAKEGQAYLRTATPSRVLAILTLNLEHKLWPEVDPGIHPSAVVHDSANVDATSYVGPHCVIEEEAIIGAKTFLQAGVYVGRHVKVGGCCRLLANTTVQDYCEIGDAVILQSGCVIGSDGYGYETENGCHIKIPQVGRVVLEDHVEVGANTTIDRARFQETRIGAGTKIDNLVQIAHNVHTGLNCLIVAQVGISGSTVLGNNVVIGGQAGLSGHLSVGDGVSIAGGSALLRSLNAGEVVRGSPAFPINDYQRMVVLQKRLPEFYKRLKTLEQIYLSPDNP